MAEGVEFCAFLSTRYLNSKLMGPAHDWVAANMPELPRGLIRMRSFHMAPDRGMTIMWFNNQKNLDEAFPGLKEFSRSRGGEEGGALPRPRALRAVSV